MAEPYTSTMNPGMECIQMPPEEVRICVAEDNHINQKLIRHFLARQCYTNIHFYENGKDTLENIGHQAAKGEPYHIVLMDIQMPVMDRMEATRLIRQHPDAAARHVPIIALWAHCVPNFERLYAIGMQDCLNKPVRGDHICDMVEKYGNPPRLVTTLRRPRL